MKRILIILLISIFMLTSCSSDDSNTKEPTVADSINIELTEFEATELKSPNNIISSNEELSYLIDYISFYKLKGPIYIKISDSYKKDIKNIKLELSRAVEGSSIGDIYHIDFDINNYSRHGIIMLTPFIRELAKVKSEGNLEVVLLPSITKENNEYHDNSYYLENNNKGLVHVSESEELYYAIINGYLPVPEVGSVASIIYTEMLEVLGRVYTEGNSEFLNAKGIYDFLTHEVKYDRVAASSSAYDSYLNQAYYLEGVFLNHLAVCDGKSKAYQMMCNYVGIENVRIKATSDDLKKHAYNYIKIDGVWYLTCPTYGSNIVEIDGINYQIPTYNMLLTTLKTPYSWTYESIMHKDIEEMLSKEPYPYYQEFGLDISNPDELIKLVSASMPSVGAGMAIEIMSDMEADHIIGICDRLNALYPSYEFKGLVNKSISRSIYSILIIEKGR